MLKGITTAYILPKYNFYSKRRTIILLEGWGVKDIEKNSLPGLKRQNKLFAKHDMHKEVFAEKIDKLF